MQKILGLGAAIGIACGGLAEAGDSAAMIRDFGLLGTWASYCSSGYNARQPGLRIVFADPPGAAPTYTTVNAEGGVATMVRSAVLEAAPAGAGQLRLRLRIIRGDRDGSPLPSPTTNTFEQVIEKVEGQGIRLVGIDPRFIQKCPN